MSSTLSSPICTIDRSVLNENTVGQMDDLGLTVFAKLCGANRGAFVLDPPDGKTYGCTAFPSSFSTNVDAPYTIPDSANLTQTFAAGNLDPSTTIEIVDQYVHAVYGSSSNLDTNPYGCDLSGLATLENCSKTNISSSSSSSGTNKARSLRHDGDLVRSVTLAGAFVPQPWATGGKVLSMENVKDFYRSRDFRQMVDLGVNTIQIPVPCDAFYNYYSEEGTGPRGGEVADTILSLLVKADKVGLSAILVLVAPDDDKEDGGDGGDGVPDEIIQENIKSAATFASESPTVIALQLPSSSNTRLPSSMLGAVRSANDMLAVLVPTKVGTLMNDLSFPPDEDHHLFAALDVSKSTDVADVASSDSVGDRMKMFYHESITCIARSPIEWLPCYHSTPVYITSGFDLSIDDCIHSDSPTFQDYGQCDRFDETISSKWWDRHRLSLASRQLFAYSKGVGWSFSAWKIYNEDGEGTASKAGGGVIDTPEKLLCLRDVAAAGLVPLPLSSSSLSSSSSPSSDYLTSVGMACLNGPKADFAMGDATFAPTPVPPPDCGNGWWNATTGVCDYWIPPPVPPKPVDYGTLAKGAGAGVFATLVLVWVAKKINGNDDGYDTLP
mmetsp:Transcript_22266/g.48290  ORF Transcript_22266/g.48290 Transcript_22266/m.48290 type:complete len:610 (+) Transcript_22266:161-1990(+)